MTTLTDLYNTRPTYGTNMPTIQPTASLYGTNMPSIPSEASMPGSSPEAASPILDQAGYFAQNPNAGFGDWLNYTQGKTAGDSSRLPMRLPYQRDSCSLNTARLGGEFSVSLAILITIEMKTPIICLHG